MKRNTEFKNFDRTMRQLMKVSHTELKAALDAEKVAKTQKQRKRKKNEIISHSG